MEKKINIGEYFNRGKFEVPKYQRGYKWSVKQGEEISALEYFINSLKKAFENNLNEYFIESVTVVEKTDNKSIELVDGQQRTTSLFLLFAALEENNLIKDKLFYDVREDSQKYLNTLVGTNEIIEDSDTQDIHYFKEAQVQITEAIANVDKKTFSNFIKDNVFLLYNLIPEEKAVNTFIALNGLKAVMKDEELIKSELLIKSSRTDTKNGALSDEEKYSVEWKINEDRGRLARNWDKWVYWWNKEEVRKYFEISNSQHPLYYLLNTYWNINNNPEQNDKLNFTFDNFKSRFIDNSINAKKHFEGLRKLQKTFEDFFNDYRSHNFLGIIIKTSQKREEALQYFLDPYKTNKISIEDYAKWSLVYATHLEIIEKKTERAAKATDAINLINQKYVYYDENDKDFDDQRKEFAFRLLMLLNLLQDNNLNRKFDFSIWNNRSLEHICPQSKKEKLDFNKTEFIEGSIHCIGNLVLLYAGDNSAFGAKDFNEKKSTYFDTNQIFKSRNLLHTISVFAKNDWKEQEIIENKKEVIKRLKIYYDLN